MNLSLYLLSHYLSLSLFYPWCIIDLKLFHSLLSSLQIAVKLKTYESALESFEQALKMARVQEDHAAEQVTKRAIDDVNQHIKDQTQEQWIVTKEG